MIFKNGTLSVLGLGSGYMVKYSPLPLGASSGFVLRNSLRQRAIFDRTSHPVHPLFLVPSKRRIEGLTPILSTKLYND